MDLSDPDPIATAAELFAGPWFPSKGRSDGRYVFARSHGPSELDEFDGALLDVSVLPPQTADPGLPAGQHLRDGEVTPDGSALIIRSYDEQLVADLLWRVPIDGLGGFGTPQLLTPEPPLDYYFTSSFPSDGAYSDDGTTLAIAGGSKYFMTGGYPVIFVVDLIDGGIVYATAGQDNEPGSPHRLHLTPDGGELTWGADFYAMPQSSTFWADVDGGGSTLALDQVGVMSQHFFDWASDERTVLWSSQENYYDGVENAFLLEVTEDAVFKHPIPVNFNPKSVVLHAGGAWLLLSSEDDGTIWAAPVTNGVPGALAPILGEQLAEDPVVGFYPDASRNEVVVVWEHLDLTRSCELLEFVDGDVDWAWDIGPCTSAGTPSIRNGHAYFNVTDVNDNTALWHLDLNDPQSSAEPISGPEPLFLTAIAPQGDWVIHSQAPWLSQTYLLTGLSQPGVSDLLEFDGMVATEAPRIVP